MPWKPYKSPRWLPEDRGYETPCWIWQLSTRTGYGVVRFEYVLISVYFVCSVGNKV